MEERKTKGGRWTTNHGILKVGKKGRKRTVDGGCNKYLVKGKKKGELIIFYRGRVQDKIKRKMDHITIVKAGKKVNLIRGKDVRSIKKKGNLN